MSDAIIIDGKKAAADKRTELKNIVDGLDKKPGLAVILVGEDPASHVYVRNKIRACEKVGIQSFEARLPEKATQAEVAAEIQAFNDNPAIDGILLQLPVPDHLDSDALIHMIKPEKDVDGLTLPNIGALVAELDGLVPCTPQGSMHLIKTVEENLSGKHAVVIGRSLLFGKPMAQLLLQENCTVTTAHSRTQNIEEICKQADILVAAVGRPKMVKGEWIKEGAIVIDVGINRLDDGTLCGDVDYEEALGKAKAITPVPGGVGPMTIAYLLANTVKAAQ
ncbi:MAG: bifunctional methylenetetrahydrofolate dehydrogenase/methenyltetrahydrofolate cyclohydrolase [Micavibrio sp. TMED27]|nr:bifunctional methylenetetrahydrofolate dehydrogenase/methenyltetrahydrofolate cyclohydrolase FolD [Micavibrio sp.]OUT90766.1 MAG: bifunctional methylenetetrahydrofolate dehydrogenase/methenyltetrahydrofolate cyclohydrolase [Micavibrio sp. TMED27]|tara:strand:+ start:2957 stop:3790 length:834 start_codon:yes stop_codon:yes gene_type:complete